MEELTKALVRKGAEHLVLFSKGEGSAVPGVGLYRVPSASWLGEIAQDVAFGASAAFLAAARGLDPGIVHTHGNTPVARGGSLIARRSGAAHVHTFHSGLMREPFRRTILSAFLPRTSHYLAVSQEVALDVAASGVPLSRIQIRPSGVRDAFFGEGSSVRTPAVVAGGRLVPLRSVLQFARGWVSARIPDVKLKVFGDGPEAGAIKALARTTSSIDWLGRCGEDELADLLQTTTVGLVLRPSVNQAHSLEGTPTLAMEMLAAGCYPVVNEGMGEAPRIIHAVGFGQVVSGLPSPQQVAQLASEIAGSAFGRTREAAREHMRRNHAWDSVAETVEDLYERLTGGKISRQVNRERRSKPQLRDVTKGDKLES